jgi:hypothetical protein
VRLLLLYPYGAIRDPVTNAWSALPEPPARPSGLEGFLGTVGDTTLVGRHLLKARRPPSSGPVLQPFADAEPPALR